MVAGLQTRGNLGLPLQTLPEGDGASAKLIGRYLGINERLILAIAQDRGIRQGDGVLNFSRLHGGGYVHVFLQLLSWIQSLNARRQGAGIRIERGRDVRDASSEGIRIG